VETPSPEKFRLLAAAAPLDDAKNTIVFVAVEAKFTQTFREHGLFFSF
jgi:hypothetical protein